MEYYLAASYSEMATFTTAFIAMVAFMDFPKTVMTSTAVAFIAAASVVATSAAASAVAAFVDYRSYCSFID